MGITGNADLPNDGDFFQMVLVGTLRLLGGIFLGRGGDGRMVAETWQCTVVVLGKCESAWLKSELDVHAKSVNERDEYRRE